MLLADGLHLGMYTLEELQIYIDSIQSAVVIDGSYCEINKALIKDIAENPDSYKTLFDSISNLKILNYLEMCNRFDNVPYYTDYELIHFMDRETFKGTEYSLTDEQFAEIVRNFSLYADRKKGVQTTGNVRVKQLVMNVLSINTKKGLYPLAYRKLNLNVKNRTMLPDKEIIICTEFSIDGSKSESVRKYLDAEDFELLADFSKNQELIKNAITKYTEGKSVVDDLPYVIGMGMDIIVDLHKEYQSIIEMYEKGQVTFPIKAFFGD
ncbi:MAG: DNA helicase, partial [Lachnospiraceae bacterium]|nr:DNA helicase [Lachnospiraceae bacterium]